MARTIGKVNKRKLLLIIAQEIEKEKITFGGINHMRLEDAIKKRIPEQWYDTWECAWSEIERLIDDAITNYVHRNVVEF